MINYVYKSNVAFSIGDNINQIPNYVVFEITRNDQINYSETIYDILRLPKVTEKTGLAKSTIYKKIALEEFPSPSSLGAKAVGWLQSDVDKWIELQIAKSRKSSENMGHANSEW